MMYRNLYRSKIQAWTQYKTENSQRIKYQTQKTVLHQSKKQKNSIKVLQEVMTFLEKHDYDKTCMDSKRKIHKHMVGTIKKTTIKLKISLKTEM